MKHDENIGFQPERFPITGLLISPVTTMGGVDEGLYIQAPGN